jgi:guanylate kinase
MATHGELILVTGFYGAGKSTLARAALDALDSLEYLQTVTTRPPRPEEGSLNQNGTVP